MANKVGLLVEGGGMKCAFSAGVLDVFLDEDVHIDNCYGVSAGSANAAFVAALGLFATIQLTNLAQPVLMSLGT